MFRLPKKTERTVIIGATGSGKSVFAMFLLANADFNTMPWVIIDYKGDDLIEEVLLDNGWRTKRVRKTTIVVPTFGTSIKQLSPEDDPPRKPGLYYMRPDAKADDVLVEAFLLKVYRQGNIGLFIDEGYAIPERDAMDMIFTQGRSKKIPVIILYQRPVYMSRYAVAQASFFACFDQNDERDLKTTKEFVKPAIAPDGTKITVYNELPPYYNLWFDVAKRKSVVLSPSPDPESIVETFSQRLNARKPPALVKEANECSAVKLC